MIQKNPMLKYDSALHTHKNKRGQVGPLPIEKAHRHFLTQIDVQAIVYIPFQFHLDQMIQFQKEKTCSPIF